MFMLTFLLLLNLRKKINAAYTRMLYFCRIGWAGVHHHFFYAVPEVRNHIVRGCPAQQNEHAILVKNRLQEAYCFDYSSHFETRAHYPLRNRRSGGIPLFYGTPPYSYTRYVPCTMSHPPNLLYEMAVTISEFISYPSFFPRFCLFSCSSTTPLPLSTGKEKNFERGIEEKDVDPLWRRVCLRLLQTGWSPKLKRKSGR